MNYNASLDDIIKQNKSKIGLKSRTRNKKWKNEKQNKGGKPTARSKGKKIKKKQNQPIMKAKLKKKKTIDVPDARIKIIQNKKKLRRKSMENPGRSPILKDVRRNPTLKDARRSPALKDARRTPALKDARRSPMLKDARRNPVLKDARLKIEARRQKSILKKSPPPRPKLISRDMGVTSLARNGILRRRINSILSNDNGIRVEYEEDDKMSLGNEPVRRTDWTELVIRRTVSNPQERRRVPATSMRYRDLDAEPEEEYMEQDSLPFNEVTRTIANVKASPSSRWKYPSRLPVPIRQSPVDEVMRDTAPVKRSYLSRESNSSRSSNHASRDSTYSSRDSNYSSRESSYPSREPRESNYSSRESTYASRASRDSSHSSREPNYFRIVISNLHDNVTVEDIKELFEDIGDLVYTKMNRNGMAEVAYKDEKDAMDAVEIYHNRQLDGLPMKCTLISNASENSTLKTRPPRLPPVSTKSTIEPDTLLIRQALFS